MRTTICYGMMFVSLGSVLTYTIVNADTLANPFESTRAFAPNASRSRTPFVVQAPTASTTPATVQEVASPTAPATDSAAETACCAAMPPIADEPTVSTGMSANDVTAAFGQPDMVSADGSRWTYGSTVLLFNSEQRVSGTVGFDPVQAAINKYESVIASITPADGSTSAKSGKTATEQTGKRSQILSRSKDSYAVLSPDRNNSRARPLNAASSRDAFRYNATGQEYSYYMNRYGPMDRVFMRKPSLPRGMSSVYDGNISRSYQGMAGRVRYGYNPSFQYRR